MIQKDLHGGKNPVDDIEFSSEFSGFNKHMSQIVHMAVGLELDDL